MHRALYGHACGVPVAAVSQAIPCSTARLSESEPSAGLYAITVWTGASAPAATLTNIAASDTRNTGAARKHAPLARSHRAAFRLATGPDLNRLSTRTV